MPVRDKSQAKAAITIATFAPLTVLVKDKTGKPLSGVVVNWSISKPGAMACQIEPSGASPSTVATDGNGNATLAAARRFAVVTSTDYVSSLLDQGAARAAFAPIPNAEFRPSALRPALRRAYRSGLFDGDSTRLSIFLDRVGDVVYGVFEVRAF